MTLRDGRDDGRDLLLTRSVLAPSASSAWMSKVCTGARLLSARFHLRTDDLLYIRITKNLGVDF